MRLSAILIVVCLGTAALAETPPAAPASEATPPAGTPSPSAPVAAPVPVERPRVVLETTVGTIVIELFPDKAPLTVANFLQYVDRHYYNGTIFHRVIANFMVQGGGFTKDYSEKPARLPIKNESRNGLSNLRGSVAMARTSDPESATSQFFFNLVNNDFLDSSEDAPGYTVFGRVVEGMGVVDGIGQVETMCPKKDTKKCTENVPPGLSDVPRIPVIVLKVYRQK